MPVESAAGPIRIAVIGDEKVGKTSLVVAQANESFPDNCPPVVPPATLPADSTPEGVPFIITDTSSRPEDRQALELACLTADVIVLLFDTGRPATLKRVSSFWMPELQRLGIHVPVVLVGAKSDLESNRTADLNQIVQPVMKKFKEVGTCLECSAKKLIYVGEVFYFALKAVVHPSAPLFDANADNGQGALKPLCVRALKRIFMMNDLDKDGALSDAELNAFQVNCFSAPLQPEELSGVRKVVSESMPQGVSATGLTLPGFLFLHALFIERGRLETTWAVLRKYGYNNDLTLNSEVLSEVNFAHNPDQVVEMTEACQAFFKQKFAEFDKNSDGLLSLQEQAEMFSTAPSGPWKGEEFKGLLVESVAEGAQTGALTLPGFLAKWAFTTALDPVRTLAYLRYLGYDGDAAPFFAISRPRRLERKSEQLSRSLLQGYVFHGSTDGTPLLDGLVGRATSSDGASTSAPSTAVGQVPRDCDTPAGGAVTLVLHQYSGEAVQVFERAPEELGPADVAVFIFDSSSIESFRQAHEQLLRVAHSSGNTLPCLLVAWEGEQGMPQEVLSECGAVCAELSLRQPIAVSPGKEDIQAVFQALVQAAIRPAQSLAIPQTPSLKAAKQYQQMLRRAALYAAGGTLGALAVYALYRLSTSQQSKSRSSPSAADVPPPMAGS